MQIPAPRDSPVRQLLLSGWNVVSPAMLTAPSSTDVFSHVSVRITAQQSLISLFEVKFTFRVIQFVFQGVDVGKQDGWRRRPTRAGFSLS